MSIVIILLIAVLIIYLMYKYINKQKNKNKIQALEEEYNHFEISMEEYLNEMKIERTNEDVLNELKQMFACTSLPIHILSNVKIGNYVIDAIVLAENNFYIINFLDTEDFIEGDLYDNYFLLYNQMEKVGHYFRGVGESRKMMNPLGISIVWRNALKKEKIFQNESFFPIVLVKEHPKYPRNTTLRNSEHFITPMEFKRVVLGRNVLRIRYNKAYIEKLYNKLVMYMK